MKRTGTKSRTIVFFDIDGTLWDAKSVIPQSTIEAIRLLKAAGNIPILCTGRAKGNVRDKKLLSLGFEGMIAACGCHVEYGGKKIYEKYMPAEHVRKVVALSKECHIPIVFEGEKKHWISRAGFDHDDFVDLMVANMGEDAVFFDEYSQDIVPNKFSGDTLVCSDVDRFRAGIPEDIGFIIHSLSEIQGIEQAAYDDANRVTGVFEAVLRGNSKAEGIRMICDYLGEDIENVIAIGDSNNDIEMVEAAGVGVAMGGSSPRLLEIADYVTDGLYNDGVYKALDHFGLLG